MASRVADFKVGNRVELAPHLDLWMRGARYGEIIAIGRSRLHVRLDATGRIVLLSPNQVQAL